MKPTSVLRAEYEAALAIYEDELKLYNYEIKRWNEVWAEAGRASPPPPNAVEPKPPTPPPDLTCKHCNGSGHVTCRACDGSGEAP